MHLIELSTNVIVDRLRVLQSDLTHENRHTDALLIDLAIQALAGSADWRAYVEAVVARQQRMVVEQAITVVRRERQRDPGF